VGGREGGVGDIEREREGEWRTEVEEWRRCSLR
jgi:hypothetical protein